MDFSHFNPLPEWKDRLNNVNEGEAWKWHEELQIAEMLYNQWGEIFGLVSAFAEALPEEQGEQNPRRILRYYKDNYLQRES